MVTKELKIAVVGGFALTLAGGLLHERALTYDPNPQRAQAPLRDPLLEDMLTQPNYENTSHPSGIDPHAPLWSQPLVYQRQAGQTHVDALKDTFDGVADVDILARMIYGECRNCKLEEQIAIAHVAYHRASDTLKNTGETLRNVLLSDAFECFKPRQGVNNFERTLNPGDDAVYDRIFEVAQGVANYHAGDKNSQYANPFGAQRPNHFSRGISNWARNPQRGRTVKILPKPDEFKHYFFVESKD